MRGRGRHIGLPLRCVGNEFSKTIIHYYVGFPGASMNTRRLLLSVLVSLALIAMTAALRRDAAVEEKHLLYVASPGIRNYVEYGGVGILVYDIAAGHKFVKRIPTWDGAEGKPAENVKGVAANAKTAKI